MQTELIKLLAAFLFAHYFVNVFMVPVKRRLKIAGRVKPFDCTVCLSVWVALFLWFLPVAASGFILVLFGAGFLANKIQ